jgi:hypothetical protein
MRPQVHGTVTVDLHLNVIWMHHSNWANKVSCSKVRKELIARLQFRCALTWCHVESITRVSRRAPFQVAIANALVFSWRQLCWNVRGHILARSVWWLFKDFDLANFLWFNYANMQYNPKKHNKTQKCYTLMTWSQPTTAKPLLLHAFCRASVASEKIVNAL